MCFDMCVHAMHTHVKTHVHLANKAAFFDTIMDNVLIFDGIF